MLLRATLLAVVASLSLHTLQSQTLVEAEYKGELSPFVFPFSVILPQFGLGPRNSFDYYTVRYTMENLAGEQDTVSGFFAHPVNVDVNDRYPRLVYQHGTTATKFGVPSRAAPGGDLPYLWASQGYVVLAPDFLNMGDDQEGFHPYVHARTEALAAIRMLEAVQTMPEYQAVANDQLFLTGYSQGGHASMALHEILVEEYPDIEVTAAAHQSGPYSISDIMLNEVILKDSTFLYPGFLPYTLLAYQAVYDDLDEPLSEIFRAPYVPFIEAFRDGYETGAVRLDSLNAQLLATYAQVEGDMTYYPSRLMLPSFVDELRNPNSAYRAALRDNDTYDFVNPTPTRLYYCRADDQVRYRNAIVAADTMNQLGASDTEAIDVNPTADHGGCVVPAVSATAQFFDQYAEIVSGTGEVREATFSHVQRGSDLYLTTGLEGNYRVELYDALGRLQLRGDYSDGAAIPTGATSTRWVLVRIIDARGQTQARQVVLR